MFSTISGLESALRMLWDRDRELTLVALGLLGELGQVDRILVTHLGCCVM